MEDVFIGNRNGEEKDNVYLFESADFVLHF